MKIALAVSALTLISYFQFPGHTYLQQDSQIYVPILERLWDPSVLPRDLLVENPHVSFTLYDEVAVALRWLTQSSFQAVLTGVQIITRALGIWGVYLLALALTRDRAYALFAAAIFSLGATIDGPAVLLTEFEPSPRAFAIPLLFLAIGLLAHNRHTWAGVAAGAAFLFHPPSALPFLLVYFAACARKHWRATLPMAGALAILLAAVYLQSGTRENQAFFSRITPDLETLQRMRASYNWVSTWWRAQIWHYLFLYGVGVAGLLRLRKFNPFLIGLPLIGMLSVPVSFALLEGAKWSLIPQLQPARTLLFVTAAAILAGAVCGCFATHRCESFLWFTAAFVSALGFSKLPLCAALALAASLALPRRWPLIPVALAAFFLNSPTYPALHNADLNALSAWAAHSTPKDALFVFPDAGHKLDPGIFRAQALRSVYVDWKGGGQVNYLKDFAAEWWRRYQDVMLKPIDPTHYRDLGNSYMVVEHPIGTMIPVYTNAQYSVYDLRR